MKLHVRVINHGKSQFIWQVLTPRAKVVLSSPPCQSLTGAQRAAYRFASLFPKDKRRSSFTMTVPADRDHVRYVPTPRR